MLEDVKRMNAASILRTCDALGVAEVCWVHTPRPHGDGFGRNEWGLDGMPNDILTSNLSRDPDLVSFIVIIIKIISESRLRAWVMYARFTRPELQGGERWRMQT